MLGICKVRPTKGGVELCEGLPVSEPEPGEIKIKVGATGICGTDLHIYHWVPWAARQIKIPQILGHEIGGIVEAIGEGVTGIKVGDLVSLESHIFCGNCYQCHTGRAHLCSDLHYPGIDRPGGFAEHVCVPARIAWVHRQAIPMEIAAMFEPFGIAVQAGFAGCGVSGQSVLITGCGPIGLMAIAVARALGAARVIATDLNPARLAAAAGLGADRVVNVTEEDPVAISMDMTGGKGVDVAMEYAGQEKAVSQALDALTRGGDLRLIGAPEKPVTIDLNRVILKGINMQGIHGRQIFHSWEHASRLVYSGKVNLQPLISHVLSLREGVRAFELIENGEAVKVMIRPEG
jgi:threonine 3-dehydrogenase